MCSNTDLEQNGDSKLLSGLSGSHYTVLSRMMTVHVKVNRTTWKQTFLCNFSNVNQSFFARACVSCSGIPCCVDDLFVSRVCKLYIITNIDYSGHVRFPRLDSLLSRGILISEKIADKYRRLCAKCVVTKQQQLSE